MIEIGTIYETESKKPCWDFCKDVYTSLGKELPQAIRDMVQVDEPLLHSIMLIHNNKQWHVGVVYPDCLHFVHLALSISDPTKYIIRQERLSGSEYRYIKKEFFVLREETL